MSGPPDDRGGPAEEAEGDLEARVDQVPIAVIKRTTRFSAEVVATMISLASAAFGVVAALAWNTAITSAFARLGKNSELSALFIYAVVVTLIGVVVIVLLGRLAGRLKAQPVEFRYPRLPPGAVS
jgi:flagellar motor component MotA